MDTERTTIESLEEKLEELRASFTAGLADPISLTAGSGKTRALHFRSGQAQFAVPASQIAQVLPARGRVMEVPDAPSHCIGAVAFQQEVFSIISVASLYSCPLEREEWLIILRPLSKRCALAVEKVEGVCTIEDSLSEGRSPLVLNIRDRAVTYLDVKKILFELGFEEVE